MDGVRLTREPNDDSKANTTAFFSWLGSDAIPRQTDEPRWQYSRGSEFLGTSQAEMTAAYLSTGTWQGVILTKPKSFGGYCSKMASAMAASWHTQRGCWSRTRGRLGGGADHGGASSTNHQPSSEDGLASSRDAPLDTASGRQRRIFDLSVAVLCDGRVTAVTSRGRGGRNVSVSPEPASLARLKKHLGSSLPVRELIGWIAPLSA